MASFAVSTPNKAANPPDCSSPLSSPPPSSVTNRLFAYSPQSSPPALADASSPPGLAPATPPAFPSSPPRHPSPSPASSSGGRPETTRQQGADDEPGEATRPVTTTRSGRRVVRKRPAEDAPADDRTPAKASPSAAAKRLRVRREAARWQPASVLSNKRSPLTNFDIRALLCKPEAWTVLSKDEQASILALFPSTTTTAAPAQGSADDDDATAGAGGAPPPPAIAALANDDNFRHDCARFRSDLAAGFFDKAWLADAFAAHAQRARGGFDAYVVDAFEENWGIPLPDAYRPGGGEGPTQGSADSQAAPVCCAGLQEKGDEDKDEDKDHQRQEHNSTETERTEPSAQETAVPPDAPVKEEVEPTQETPDAPDAAKAEAAEADTKPRGRADTESTPAPGETTPVVLTKNAPPQATGGRRAPRAAAPAQAERPARRAARRTPAAKPETKTQGRRAAVKRQQQAGPSPAVKEAGEKAAGAAAAAAFDWEFPDDGDETGTPPVALGDALPASPEAAAGTDEGSDEGTDAGSDADADADWKPARKPARRGPRAGAGAGAGAGAKRRASSTVAVRGRKKKTPPGRAESGDDGH